MHTFGVKNDRTCLPKKVLLEPLYEDFIYKWHQKFRNETLGKVTKFAEHCLIYKGTVHEKPPIRLPYSNG